MITDYMARAIHVWWCVLFVKQVVNQLLLLDAELTKTLYKLWPLYRHLSDHWQFTFICILGSDAMVNISNLRSLQWFYTGWLFSGELSLCHKMALTWKTMPSQAHHMPAEIEGCGLCRYLLKWCIKMGRVTVLNLTKLATASNPDWVSQPSDAFFIVPHPDESSETSPLVNETGCNTHSFQSRCKITRFTIID